jgi:folate-dependent tRNA-U54 methylase TrmFO/GidA
LKEYIEASKEKNTEQRLNKIAKVMNSLDMANFMAIVPLFFEDTTYSLKSSNNTVTYDKIGNDYLNCETIRKLMLTSTNLL